MLTSDSRQSNTIVAFFPEITSISDIHLLHLLKEIIETKSLHGSAYVPEIIPSLTGSNSLTVNGDYQSSQSLSHVNSNIPGPWKIDHEERFKPKQNFRSFHRRLGPIRTGLGNFFGCCNLDKFEDF